MEIESGVIEGKFPKRALNLVMEWYERHREELLANWNSLEESGEFQKLPPLE